MKVINWLIISTRYECIYNLLISSLLYVVIIYCKLLLSLVQFTIVVAMQVQISHIHLT